MHPGGWLAVPSSQAAQPGAARGGVSAAHPTTTIIHVGCLPNPSLYAMLCCTLQPYCLEPPPSWLSIAHAAHGLGPCRDRTTTLPKPYFQDHLSLSNISQLWASASPPSPAALGSSAFVTPSHVCLACLQLNFPGVPCSASKPLPQAEPLAGLPREQHLPCRQRSPRRPSPAASEEQVRPFLFAWLTLVG